MCPGQPPSVPPRRPAFLRELPRPRRRGGTHRCQRLTGVAPGRQAPRGPGRRAPRGLGRQAPRGPHSRTLCPAPGHEGPASPAGRRVFTGRARAGKGQSENVGRTLTEGQRDPAKLGAIWKQEVEREQPLIAPGKLGPGLWGTGHQGPRPRQQEGAKVAPGRRSLQAGAHPERGSSSTAEPVATVPCGPRRGQGSRHRTGRWGPHCTEMRGTGHDMALAGRKPRGRGYWSRRRSQGPQIGCEETETVNRTRCPGGEKATHRAATLAAPRKEIRQMAETRPATPGTRHGSRPALQPGE